MFIGLLGNVLTEGRELVRLLLSAGADPTAQDMYCRTALHTAAMVNDAELMKVAEHHLTYQNISDYCLVLIQC